MNMTYTLFSPLPTQKYYEQADSSRYFAVCVSLAHLHGKQNHKIPGHTYCNYYVCRCTQNYYSTIHVLLSLRVHILFCWDVANSPIKSNVVNWNLYGSYLHIEFLERFPENIEMYILIISDCHMSISTSRRRAAGICSGYVMLQS